MLFSKSDNRLFYGWRIVGAAFLIMLYVGGVVIYGFTAIFEPIAIELCWSYAQIATAASLRGLETSLLAPLVGILADRIGPRKLIFAGSIILAAGLLLMSRTTSLVVFYFAFMLIATGLSCCTITVLMTALANWFQKRIGLATGIATSGAGFGGLLIPIIVLLTDTYDWRLATGILAIATLGIITPLALIFRHKP